MEWYVARGGQAHGPLTFDDLLIAARNGRLQRGDFVWTTGMADWSPASEVHELWAKHEPVVPPKVDASAPNAGSESSESQPIEARSHGQSSIIVRHWRGELTLAQAYWGVCFLLTFCAIALGYAVGAFIEEAHLGPRWSGIILVSFVLFLCGLTLWQVIGTWRSAGNHIAATRRYFWANAARLALILGVIRAGVDFVNVIGPILSEGTKLAIGVDDTPAHQLRLLRAGTELELSGGMPFGTAAALQNLLDAAPTVKIIHLNSLGGRVSEGYEVHKLVRQHKLITYTSTDCVSACTIAFLAGGQRYLASSGRLGFHSANFGGLDEKVLPEINTDIRRTLRQHGVEAGFINRALATSGDSMWYPTHGELVHAGVVTKIVDAAQFGLSGIAEWRDKDALERILAAVPGFAAIRENDPDGFGVIAKRFAEGVQAGQSINEIVQDTQAILASQLLPKYLQVGPDVQLVDYWKTQIAEMDYLEVTSPSACVQFLFPELRSADFNLVKLVPAALIEQDIAALSALIRATVHAQDRQPSATVDQDLKAIVEVILRRNPDADEILSEPIKYRTQPKLLCSTITAFYKQILQLPAARSGPILRELMSK
jgi:hypothetical protein